MLFPGVVLPITVGRPRSIAAAQQAVREQRQVGILMQRDASRSPTRSRSTCIASARSPTSCATSRRRTARTTSSCQGEQRFQVVEFLDGWPFLVARVLRIPEPDTRTPEIEARFLNLQRQAVEALELLPQAPPELLAAVQSVRLAGRARRSRRRLHGS